jgi:peptidoglycan/xylan/chitin deacetylase (PgdA/CDA1 family)
MKTKPKLLTKTGRIGVLTLMILMLTIGVVLAGPHEITAWQGNRAGAVSLTFDDGIYPSQLQVALPALNQRGIKGSFNLIADWTIWSWWPDVVNAGHEIGSHTLTHPFLTQLSPADASYEIATSRELIEANIPGQLSLSFAYPYGAVNSTVESLIRQYYIGARGVGWGLNDYQTNNYNLLAYDVSPFTVSQMAYLADQAAGQGKWLINIFHSFDPTQYGTWSPDQFISYLDYLKGKTDLWIAPLSTVLKYMGERNAANLTVVSQTNDTITLNLTTGLPSAVFNCPLTIRSEIPSNWITVKVQQGNTVTTVLTVNEGGANVVYYDALPDQGVITLSAGSHSITPWHGNRSGAVSLTFDDGFYPNQYTIALPALNQRGFKGTFFVVSDWATWSWWTEAVNSGHEIGSHSLTHLNLTQLSLTDAENEIATSRQTIETNIPNQWCLSFAYPYGAVNPSVKSQVMQHYIGARGVGYGLNDYTTDNYNLNAYDVGAFSVSQIEYLTDQAATKGKWFIPIFHSFDPSLYGTWTGDQFLAYMNYLEGRSDLWIAPFGTVVKYMGERLSSTLTGSAQPNNVITFNLTAGLPTFAFNSPLTIRSEVPSNWTFAQVQQGTTITTVPAVTEGNAKVLYFDALPDQGVITLTLLPNP